MKSAYRKRVAEYDPDKVAALGAELRGLAEAKTKQINEAYRLIEQHRFGRGAA
jgi:DnaJ like chaperone protein